MPLIIGHGTSSGEKMKAFRFLVASLVGLAVASLPAQAQDKRYANYKTLGIVSLLGGAVEFQHFDQMNFTESVERRTLSWGLDDMTAKLTIKALGDRFLVKDTPVDSALMLKEADDPRRQEGGREFWFHQIQAQRKDDGVDAYVVFYPAEVHNGRIRFGGVSFLKEAGSFFIGGRQTEVSVNVRIWVIDAKTGEFVYRALFSTDGAAMTTCDDSLWVDPSGALAPDVEAGMKSALIQTIAATLPKALDSAGLTETDAHLSASEFDDGRAAAKYCRPPHVF